MAYDFTPTPGAIFATAFQNHIDGAMEAAKLREPPRTYLGGSELGNECLRALGYSYFRVPRDKPFTGPSIRMMDMGTDGEVRMEAYLRLAGFGLVTRRGDGQQIGFGVAKDGQGHYRIEGHIDGVITSWPLNFVPPYPGVEAPCLWENKALNNKGWGRCFREGVKNAKPLYYAQMQVYMPHLDLIEHPALFTATNRDTGDLYAELVPFDLQAAQEATDRGVKVISARSVEELPRIASVSTDWRCRQCDWEHKCWHQLLDEPAPVGEGTPPWVTP